MARGDVVNGITTVAGGGSITIQPAVGVEYLIRGASSSLSTGTAPDLDPNIRVALFDGAYFADTYHPNLRQKIPFSLNLFVRNAN